MRVRSRQCSGVWCVVWVCQENMVIVTVDQSANVSNQVDSCQYSNSKTQGMECKIGQQLNSFSSALFLVIQCKLYKVKEDTYIDNASTHTICHAIRRPSLTHNFHTQWKQAVALLFCLLFLPTESQWKLVADCQVSLYELDGLTIVSLPRL